GSAGGASRRSPRRRSAGRSRSGPDVARPGGLRAVLGPVTSLGGTVAVIGAASWWAGAQLGWEELLIVAGTCLVALVVALAWTLGRLGLDIDVELDPNRV